MIDPDADVTILGVLGTQIAEVEGRLDTRLSEQGRQLHNRMDRMDESRNRARDQQVLLEDEQRRFRERTTEQLSRLADQTKAATDAATAAATAAASAAEQGKKTNGRVTTMEKRWEILKGVWLTIAGLGTLVAIAVGILNLVNG